MLLRARKSSSKKEDSGGDGSSGRLTSPQRAAEPLTVTFNEDEVATVFSPFKVVLRNEGEANMLFKVQTNIPRRYRVAPEPFGLLHPREVAVLEIFAVVEDDDDAGEANSDNNAGHDDRSNQGGRKTPGRSRSASRSLAALLQYRERETAQEVSAESAAAVAMRRESRRESFLSRRASDLRTESELSATRRALTTQMSFFSAENARESARASGGDAPEEAKEMARRVETSSKSTSTTRLRDLLRVEGRFLSAKQTELDSSTVKQLRKCRERHRDEWQQCTSSSFVQIVPLKSEPLTKQQFVHLLAQAEEPMGIPALRSEQQTVIDAVHDLQQALQQLEASIEYTTKSQQDQRSHLESEMTRLTSLRNGCDGSEWNIVQRRALENEECDERNRIVVSANENLCELAESCAAYWKMLEEAMVERSRQEPPALASDSTTLRDDEASRGRVEGNAECHDNPPPPADFPLLGSIVVPRWIAVVAVLSSVWSAVLRPALYGEF